MFNNRLSTIDFNELFVSGMSAAELARKARVKVPVARDWLLHEVNHERLHTVLESSGRSARYHRGHQPLTARPRAYEFTPYKPPRPGIIPVRAGNAPAPDATVRESPRWMV